MAMFKKLEGASPVVDYKIRNYTREELEEYIGDPVRHSSLLADLNNYAYGVLGPFRELVDFYVKPALYRWSVGARATHPHFLRMKNKTEKLEKDYIAYCAKVCQLNIGRELHRLLLKMFLEDAVFGWWLEGGGSSTIYYLPQRWCVLDSVANGNWTYKINAPRVSQRELEKLPREIQALVKRHQKKGGDEAKAPVPYEKAVCFKYHDHLSAVFPPFTYVLLLVMDMAKSKRISLAKDEQDAVNLIQMLIPYDKDADDHLRFTDPLIEKFALGLQELADARNAILPTPMELSVLETSKNKRAERDVAKSSRDAFNEETGLPRFGGSNTAAEMKRALENAGSKVFLLLDQISHSVNLKMKHDGFVYNYYEFVFEILHMNQFNKAEAQDLLLKQSQGGAVNKFKLEGSYGTDPCMLVGQHFLENAAFRRVFDDLVVPPSSHTKAAGDGGRPPMGEADLSPAGEQARRDGTNDPAARDQ